METVVELPRTLEPPQQNSVGVERSETRELWAARALIIGVAAALTWYTWEHWGSFQIDNGRELYVPAEILKGKLLFRDLWYMYGPLAPYVKALLFRIFGVQLMVLYIFGLALTFGTALVTFEVSRLFRMGIVGSTLPPLLFLVEAFYPFIRNFVFPYSYAASVGTFLGTLCLYYVLSHASEFRPWQLALASVLTGLEILDKQEFGAACLALLLFEIAACYWNRRSSRELFRNMLILCSGLLPAVAVYGWFVWKTSARTIFIENWISTPGTYFMRTFGKVTLPGQGLRFVPKELLQTAEFTILALAMWALFAIIAVSVIKRLKLRSPTSIAVSAMAALTPFWAVAIVLVKLHPRDSMHLGLQWLTILIPVTQAAFPKGIFFLVVLFACHALWQLLKSPQSEVALQESGLCIYACLIAFRQMMELPPDINVCAVFFNVPAFLVFTILLYKIFRWACRSLDEKRSNIVVGSLLAAETMFLFILFFPNPKLLTTRLTTDNGSFYTRADVATIFPQIISFMKSHTQNGKDILFIPEPPSLYTFAGMEAPSRWYGLVPGYVSPDQEQQYIDEVAANHVRYVLISNRIVSEYKVPGFAQGGYNPTIYKWIMANYVKVGQFGPLPDAVYPPYIVWVYEKKDLPEKIDLPVGD
jgi:hypothetical protein